jgi:hypothetical protein
VKAVGGQVSKVTYDRLGRATHTFILAKDIDTTYADSIVIRAAPTAGAGTTCWKSTRRCSMG